MINKLCISSSLNKNELIELNKIIERNKPIQKNHIILKKGDKFKFIYAIRSGSIKNYTIDKNGKEQITNFSLSGDIIGFEAIYKNEHSIYSKSLETSMICKIQFNNLNHLINKIPKIKRKLIKLMSYKIYNNNNIIILLKKKAEQKLSTFIYYLSIQFNKRGFSKKEFRLTMTRKDIGNYLGLTVETISRLLRKLQKKNIILIKGKYIIINNENKLYNLTNK